MIGLDTNILVRYIVQDDAVQSARAAELIEALTQEIPGFVSIIAMVETAWVLERSYRLVPTQIAAAIERMPRADTLVIECRQQVFTAMIALKNESGTFADALIASLGASAGCSHTLTFDRRALSLPGFVAA